MASNAVKFNLQYFSLKEPFCILFPVFLCRSCHGIVTAITSFVYKTNRGKPHPAVQEPSMSLPSEQNRAHLSHAISTKQLKENCFWRTGTLDST